MTFLSSLVNFQNKMIQMEVQLCLTQKYFISMDIVHRRLSKHQEMGFIPVKKVL